MRFPVAIICFTLLAGCEKPPIDFLEVRRIDEALRPADLDQLARIAKQMPNGRLPSLSPHFLPAPRWDSNRPATVATLSREELERLRESTQLDVLVRSNGRNARLRYALKQESLTDEQYTALLLAVGMAVQKSRLDPARDLERYVRDGRGKMKQLADRKESFAAMPRDDQIRALDDATWITRVDRAERLLRVPMENVTLVAGRTDELAKLLPKQFLKDPLASVADPLRDYGVPFRERPDSGFDSELTWLRSDEQAIVDR